MHYLYFVSIKQARDKKEAMKKARQILDQNNFASNGGFFSASKADWYQVGGRWADEFRQLDERYLKNKNKLQKEVEKIIKKAKLKDVRYEYLAIDPHMIKSDEVKKEIEEVSKKLTGYSFFIDTDKDTEEACIKVTKAIANKLFLSSYREVECLLVDKGDYIDREEQIKFIKAEELVDSWLVIIDYHN